MKKFLCALALAIASFSPAMAENIVTLYLNSGNVVTGTLQSAANAPTVVITASNGQTYTYSQSEIRKIDVGENTTPQLSNNNRPRSGEGYYTPQLNRNSGFWGAVESVTGMSCRINKHNTAFEEVDVVAGYRFNEFFRVGAGIGGRYYFDSKYLRYGSLKWSMPLFINVRGGFMDHAYRNCVPFYSVDFGGAIRDGLMVRPSLGIKIGGLRSAFTIALSYSAQAIKGWKIADISVPADPVTGTPATTKKVCVSDNQVISLIALKLGYEF